MHVGDFNDNFLRPLIAKTQMENKNVILLGDFNINLMNHDTHHDTNEFLNLMYQHNMLPIITKPTRITIYSKTLIDNVFTNMIEHLIFSGNLTYTISDHLMQIASFRSSNPNIRRTSTKQHNFKKFNREKLLADITNINWDEKQKL